MRKVIFAFFISTTLATSVNAQRETEEGCPTVALTPDPKGIMHFSFGRSQHHVALTTNLRIKIGKNSAVFFGSNIAPSTGSDQTEKIYPYRAIYDSYKGMYAGFAISPTDNFTIGVGAEYQETTKKFAVPGGYEDIKRVCLRLYSQGKIDRTDFLITLNAFGRLFDCWGYWTTPVGKKIDLGLYANTSSTGIGPMVRWGFKKSIHRPFGVALGYNPESKESGIVLIAQNF